MISFIEIWAFRIVKGAAIMAFICADWTDQWAAGSWAASFAATFHIAIAIYFLAAITNGLTISRKATESLKRDNQ